MIHKQNYTKYNNHKNVLQKDWNGLKLIQLMNLDLD